MAFEALVASVVAGTVVGAAAQFQAGRQAKEVADFNADVQTRQAKQEEQAAAFNADLRQEQGRKLLAKQRLAFTAAGVGIEGTPLLVLEETAREITAESSRIRFGGQLRASNLRSRAGLSAIQGRSAAQAGVIRAGTTLLSGATNIADLTF